ncbi:MAG TPA: hypothetical protein VM802_13910 [Chitinophaga sp.]|uniref:hypothetical protein n=1 Tax=Chitinophaga sp. TaxID=1869181 RepID=UPI002BCBBED0|nr:hypothetical protein [Chitinophaga sp.]HVI45966.1 hypothetical protein [Chitinophaga sp.]
MNESIYLSTIHSSLLVLTIMQHFRVWLILAVFGLAACNSGNSAADKTADQSKTEELKPATPAGSVSVSISKKDKDTSEITINFQIKDLKKEKSFEQAILKDAADADLYRVLWDEPNSAYIGVLKPNHTVRYYHASQEASGDLKILWATSPPERIWKYMENTMGLGKVSSAGKPVNKYSKGIQSGKILADFIAEIRPNAAADSVELYVEFGGVRKSMFMPVPKGYAPTIQQTAQDDHVFFSLIKDGKAEPFIDMKVENGRLQVHTLKEIKKD